MALALLPSLIRAGNLDEAVEEIWQRIEDKNLNCYISEEHKVVLGTSQDITSVANEIGYLENTGYVRKDIDLHEPSQTLRTLIFANIDQLKLNSKSEKGMRTAL